MCLCDQNASADYGITNSSQKQKQPIFRLGTTGAQVTLAQIWWSILVDSVAGCLLLFLFFFLANIVLVTSPTLRKMLNFGQNAF